MIVDEFRWLGLCLGEKEGWNAYKKALKGFGSSEEGAQGDAVAMVEPGRVRSVVEQAGSFNEGESPRGFGP